MSGQPQAIKLKKHLTIGAISAENDSSFLWDCFIDTGDYSALTDPECDRSIILGRTGAGKSALLEMIKVREDNVIEVEPAELALNYISHSNILCLLEECGVNLDPFYQLLWKHIFVVELIRFKYQIKDEQNLSVFLNSLATIFNKDKAKEAAIDYLKLWQDKFWLPVEERVKEITQRIETQLSKTLGGGIETNFLTDIFSPSITASARREKISTLTREEKEEIRNKVSSAVDSVQIQQLHQVIKLLSEDIFNDPQEIFYIVIDKLDETWVEDTTRYKLIRALIDTIKSFRKIRSVKFLIALRVDLLQTVFTKTRDRGFQEDKFQDYILQLRWDNNELESLLAKRIAHLFKRQYEKKDALVSDLLPSHVGNSTSIDWFVKRSLMRPRDIIVYLNICLDRAAGSSSISASVIRDMEISFSQERLSSVCQEWLGHYPGLELSKDILKNKRDGFTHSDLNREDIEKLANDILLLDLVDGGYIYHAVEDYLNKDITRSSFINRLMSVFYIVGLIGIKRDGSESTIWSSLDSATVTETEVKRSSHFYIHPMFWRALGTHVDKRKL